MLQAADAGDRHQVVGEFPVDDEEVVDLVRVVDAVERRRCCRETPPSFRLAASRVVLTWTRSILSPRLASRSYRQGSSGHDDLVATQLSQPRPASTRPLGRCARRGVMPRSSVGTRRRLQCMADVESQPGGMTLERSLLEPPARPEGTARPRAQVPRRPPRRPVRPRSTRVAAGEVTVVESQPLRVRRPSGVPGGRCALRPSCRSTPRHEWPSRQRGELSTAVFVRRRSAPAHVDDARAIADTRATRFEAISRAPVACSLASSTRPSGCGAAW